MGQQWSNCDELLRVWIAGTVETLSEALGANLVGAYLHGSLASGSFYPPKSDVDVLFVVRLPLGAEERRQFATCCVERSERRPMVGGFECSVILEHSAREAPHPMPFEVHFGEEWTEDILASRVDYDLPRSDPDLAAHCQAVREFGVTLRGRPAEEVFAHVELAHFEESVDGDLTWILEGDHLLESPFYGVLNACRVLWVWSGHSHRLVPSKEEAGEWALGVLPSHLHRIVEDALTAYRDHRDVSPETRQTAGLVWDETRLFEFRDWMRETRALRLRGKALDEG